MFRFTIRELVQLTLVVVLGLGWWLDRRRLVGPLAKLAEYQLGEQRELGRQKDEKRLQDLLWKRQSATAINEYGAPAPKPLKERPRLTPAEWEEIEQLSAKLGK